MTNEGSATHTFQCEFQSAIRIDLVSNLSKCPKAAAHHRKHHGSKPRSQSKCTKKPKTSVPRKAATSRGLCQGPVSRGNSGGVGPRPNPPKRLIPQLQVPAHEHIHTQPPPCKTNRPTDRRTRHPIMKPIFIQRYLARRTQNRKQTQYTLYFPTPPIIVPLLPLQSRPLMYTNRPPHGEWPHRQPFAPSSGVHIDPSWGMYPPSEPPRMVLQAGSS
jgi:hypothetical protein